MNFPAMIRREAKALCCDHISFPNDHLIQRSALRFLALAAVLLVIAVPQQVTAYDACVDGDRCTHEEMTGYGLSAYNSLFPGIYDGDDVSFIQYGAGHEDEIDHGYGYDGFFVTATHFWLPDIPFWDLPTGIPFINGDEPNGWQKSRQYWMRALGEYVYGNTDQCTPGFCFPANYGPLHYLGHVAHHVGDNTIPTHAHADAHDPFSNDDAFEDWMSQGAETDLGSQDGAPDQPPGSDLLVGELPILSAPVYVPMAGGLDPLDAMDESFVIPAGAIQGAVETPLERLYWLLYTTNQIAGFFPSQNVDGDMEDPELWVVTEHANMDSAITSPRDPDDLDNNTCHSSAFGGCGSGTIGDYDNNFYDNDLGVIREYSYLRGVRALAGLAHLFQQTVDTQALIAVDVSKVEITDGDCDDLTALPACEAYAQVTIGNYPSGLQGSYLTGRNEGDALEVGEGQFVYTYLDKTSWRWGNTLVDAMFTDTDGRDKVFIKIEILDDDADTAGVQVDDIIDVSAAPAASYVQLRVDLDKCEAGDADAIEILDLTLTTAIAFGACGELIESGNGDEDYLGTAEGIVTFSVNMVLENTPPVAEAGGPYSVGEGGSVGLDGSGSSDSDEDELTFAWDLDDDGVFETAGVAPDFSAAGLDGPDSVTVTLQVSDGFQQATDTATVNITNVAPSGLTFSATTIDENGNTTLSGSFSDPGTLDTFSLDINWGDPLSPGNTEEVSLGTDRTFSIQHQYLDDNPTATPSDSYTISVTVTDDDTGSTSNTAPVMVNNVIPVVAAPVTLPGPSDEGSAVVASATFTDVGTLDTHQCTVDYGDGTGDLAATVLDGTCIGPAHTYADNGIYTVTVKVTDDDTGLGFNSSLHQVDNVAPEFADSTNSAELCGLTPGDGIVEVTAEFTDPGFDWPLLATVESFTAIIDWGDGVIEAGLVDSVTGSVGTPSSGLVSGSHVYANGGIFTITITVEDDDGGSDSITMEALVSGAGINDGEIQMVGTQFNDWTKIDANGRRMEVSVELMADLGKPDLINIEFGVLRRYVTSIRVLTCAGADRIEITDNIRVPALLNGGGGKDFIQGGNGVSLLEGGPGDDILLAGDAGNTLNGGDGADELTGGKGPDILSGNAGDDTLWGRMGDDFLNGGADTDLCNPGAGADTVVNCEPPPPKSP